MCCFLPVITATRCCCARPVDATGIRALTAPPERGHRLTTCATISRRSASSLGDRAYQSRAGLCHRTATGGTPMPSVSYFVRMIAKEGKAQDVLALLL